MISFKKYADKEQIKFDECIRKVLSLTESTPMCFTRTVNLP
jgi:hypothetical protein